MKDIESRLSPHFTTILVSSTSHFHQESEEDDLIGAKLIFQETWGTTEQWVLALETWGVRFNSCLPDQNAARMNQIGLMELEVKRPKW